MAHYFLGKVKRLQGLSVASMFEMNTMWKKYFDYFKIEV
jgi:hypothetical protein